MVSKILDSEAFLFKTFFKCLFIFLLTASLDIGLLKYINRPIPIITKMIMLTNTLSTVIIVAPPSFKVLHEISHLILIATHVIWTLENRLFHLILYGECPNALLLIVSHPLLIHQ
jgi:hypothetical protein